MEKMLTNMEFNQLVDQIQIENFDYNAAVLGDPSEQVDLALEKMKIYWKVIKPLLAIAKIAVPQKVDKAIDEFRMVVDKLLDGTTGEERSELLEKFAVIWGIVKPILESIKEFTGAKADAIINEVIKIGDLLAKS